MFLENKRELPGGFKSCSFRGSHLFGREREAGFPSSPMDDMTTVFYPYFFEYRAWPLTTCMFWIKINY